MGPFANAEIATQFEHYAIHFAGIATYDRAVQMLRGGWYIAVPRDGG